MSPIPLGYQGGYPTSLSHASQGLTPVHCSEVSTQQLGCGTDLITRRVKRLLRPCKEARPASPHLAALSALLSLSACVSVSVC